MRTFILLYVLLFLVQNSLAQEIQFEKDTFDFGKVLYDSDPTRYIKIINSGVDTIEISHINTACGCDMSFVPGPTKILYPKSEGLIAYRFDTKLVRRYNNTLTVFIVGSKKSFTTRVKWEVLPKDSLPLIDWSLYKYPKNYNNPKPIGIKFNSINLQIPDSLKTNVDFYVQLINPQHTYTFKKTGKQKMNVITVDTNTVLRVHYNGRNIDVFNFRQYCGLDKSQLLTLTIFPNGDNSCFWASYFVTQQFIYGAKSKAPCNTCLDQSFPCDYYNCTDCMHIEILPDISLKSGQ